MAKRKRDELSDLRNQLDRKAIIAKHRPPRQKAGDLVDPFGFEETTHASFELGSAAYQLRNPEIAIITTSLGIDATLHQRLALLDIRAAAYGMTGRFEDGLRDAEEMIRLAPEATVGYRRAGEIYCMQGYSNRAIDVYEQGLQKVNDQHWWRLEDGLNEAKALQETCIDFIANAPYDIVTNIMQYLTIYECIPLLDISKAWRRQISACSAVWSSIKIDDYNEVAKSRISFLAHVSSQVTSICLEWLDNATCEAVFFHIASGDFEKLESIIIYGCSFERNEGFFSAISRVSMTLKELTVKVLFRGSREVQPEIPFNTVLATCRNLQSFTYHNQSCTRDHNFYGYLGFPQTSTVTSLSLGINCTKLSNLADTLRFCPEIQHLNLYYFLSSKHMDVIDQYCKNLVSFCFNNELHEEATRCIQSQQVATDMGIRHMALRIDETHNFTSLFTMHCTTVESMSLFILPSARDLMQLSMVGEFNNLQYLELKYGSGQLSTFVASMISTAPRLRHLTFEHCVIDGSILGKDIAHLPALEKLQIRCCTQVQANFSTIFDSIAAKGNTATLREVLLGERTAFTMDLMESLTNIPTLRRINLVHCSSRKQTMKRFCAKLQLHPCIEDIRITGVNCVNDEALNPLSAVNGLKRLELRDLDRITEDLLSDFDDSVTLVISGCKNLDNTS